MSTLLEIKSRIATVGTIKKITKAMQLVATAKLITCKKSLEGIKAYCHEVYDIFHELLKVGDDISNIIEQPQVNKVFYIIITSDLGLCGAYNANVIKLAHDHLKPNDEIIVVGSKGASTFKNKPHKLVVFDHIGDRPNYLIASEITKIAISKFLAGEIKAIKIIHTQYINVVSYQAQIMTVLPIVMPITSHKINSQIEFEPDPQTIIMNSLPLYIAAILYGVMSESKVAEMTSRRMAMENASDNASELIEKLNLEYNRARQSKITQEISEIVAGSEIE